MEQSNKWKVGDVLVAGGSPGTYCEVKKVPPVNYEVRSTETGAVQEISKLELETYWSKASDEEVMEAENELDPPEPNDPDFDEDGMPTFIRENSP